MVMHKMAASNDAMQAMMGKIAKDQAMMDGVLNMAVQDPTMKEHLMTLMKGMGMPKK
jgi:hypothetical protein